MSDGRFFVGLPIPAAAAMVAALVNFRPAPIDDRSLAIACVSLLIVLSFLMVSTFRYWSFKKVDLRSRRSYVMIVGIAVSLILVALHTEWVLLLLATAFWLSGPARLPGGRGPPAAGPGARSGGERVELSAAPPAETARRFDRVHVGVGAVVIHEGRVLLIRRGKEPLRGRWVVPGGTVELGETLEDAVVREVQEETGLTVAPREVVTVFDRIERDGEAVRYHYVIVDYLCDYVVRLAPGGFGRRGRRTRGARGPGPLRPAAQGPGGRA